MPTTAACQTCKLRRIKCDGGKPTCERCAKSRRICIESTPFPQAPLQIHLENQYASGKIKRPRGPRSNLTSRPSSDLHTRALAYYQQYHLQPDGEGLPAGLSCCVHAWKSSGRSSELVDLALSAMALAVWFRAQQDSTAPAEACSVYDRLIPLVKQRLSDLSTLQQRDVDATLLAIFLMGRYEGVMHGWSSNAQHACPLWQGWSHHDGVMALLKFWYDNLSHEPATAIIKHTRRGSVRSSLLRTRPLQSWLINGERFGEQGLDLEDDLIRVRTVSLRCTLAKLSTNERSAEQAEKIDLEAQELDKALQDWADKALSGYHIHSVVAPDTLPSKHLYSTTVYSYDTLASAARCAQYFATRMILISTRTQAREKVLAATRDAGIGGLLCDRPQMENKVALKAMANSLASTLPFCLGLFEAAQVPGCRPALRSNDSIRPWHAGLLVWPLTIASSLRSVDDKQLTWFRTELTELGRMTADGFVQDTQAAQLLKM